MNNGNMTNQQAQQNLQNLIDTCAIKGNIYGSAADCIAIQQSLNILVQALQSAEQRIDSLQDRERKEDNGVSKRLETFK